MTPDAWKGHAVHPVLFVFAQKTDKFQFVVNGMRTIRGWCSAGLQFRSHIHAFSLRTVREWFTNHSARLCIQGLINYLEIEINFTNN